MRKPIRAAAGLATATVLALAASGCVTVHGELAVLPTVNHAEAAKALKDFTTAYNAADKANKPSLDSGITTGSLAAINQAGLRARSVTSPQGNTSHQDLALKDPQFVIPEKAGWPRWFLAVAKPGNPQSGSATTRWLVVFVRDSPTDPWRAAYLTLMAANAIPAFQTGKDGYARPVEAKDAALAVAPKNLSARYASYLQTGSPDVFAPGAHTDQWRARRAKQTAAITVQYIDQPLTSGDFAPLGLATKDGGALVFFATRYYQRQTTAKGFTPTVPSNVVPLTKGKVKNTFTQEYVSSEVAEVPPAAGSGKVAIVSRLEGVTAATGS
jgi:hypothetical protein